MKILAVTGKSGGHIFPALSFLQDVISRYPEAETGIVLPASSVTDPALFRGISRCFYITCVSIPKRVSFTSVAAVIKFFRSFFDSLWIVYTFKPDCVAGFGSISSVPVVIAARICGVKKIILHEQNVIPGRATRFLLAFADACALSFENSKTYFDPAALKKIFLTGNMLRKSLVTVGKNEAVRYFGLKPDIFTLVVMGGSQGSRTINTVFSRDSGSLRTAVPFQVIHITGKNDFEGIKKHYESVGFPSRVFDFFEAMHYVYSAADLVISRGGATTISELIFYRIPAIIIPYPFAYNHQAANALVLKEKNCAEVMTDTGAESGMLRDVVEELLNTPDKIKEMKENYNAFTQRDAHSLFMDLVTR
ncbi:MAG: UDP-N-acetylglucosamine--N-acetylmuramyl-(pentapeptide) pyrophosphoryl-undecaprenol N-acetylglucosamine transferase [Candidatus Omnitrophica bacterium]|nr:UDP-N-acetylglucosamine--N-acetylmuramyl-(pentapeptide) pyrophosphoryl-undecaprenol N-acetylglucosamine transferase [Candidatus Omnitrophota bacterium]